MSKSKTKKVFMGVDVDEIEGLAELLGDIDGIYAEFIITRPVGLALKKLIELGIERAEEIGKGLNND